MSDKSRYPVLAKSIAERGRDYRRHLRMEALLTYGGKCTCCGEWRYEFLTIDHINNDGAEHRRKLANGRDRWKAKNIYVWLKENDYPEGFQVLCTNCNCAKAWHGYCPHTEESQLSQSQPQ